MVVCELRKFLELLPTNKYSVFFCIGGIPSFLWNMPSLRYVNFGSNHLKGNLPEEMCHQLPLLEVFDVDGNQLEGSIPRSISNCTSLKELYLDINSFTGMYFTCVFSFLFKKKNIFFSKIELWFLSFHLCEITNKVKIKNQWNLMIFVT